jgi:hypothetical protein
VQPGDQGAHLLTEHRGQRGGLRLDQHDGDPELAQTGGDLAADETGADDHRVAAEDACPRSASASSSERSTRMPSSSGNDGIRLGTRPVAITSSS